MTIVHNLTRPTQEETPMPTFADLRQSLTPPTPADVVAAFGEELRALEAEFTSQVLDAWPTDGAAARRLALDVCAELHSGMWDRDIRTMLQLLRLGDAETNRAAATGQNRDAEIDQVAHALVVHAEAMATEWRRNMGIVA
jgi:hypothetical protein